MAGFTNDIMNADNVNFSGSNPTVGQITANGQLMIGAGSAPFLRPGTLTAGTGISITNGPGSISIATTAALNGFNQIVTQVFTTTGANTYTPTSGMKYCIVEVQGAGGGGGGANSTGSAQVAGGGGGAGAYAKGVFSAATVGASQTVTIGTGGTAGSSAGGNGGTGGTSSFGSLISCTGGVGGSGSSPGSVNGAAAGGAGGTASGSGVSYSITGAKGFDALWMNAGGAGVLFDQSGRGGQAMLGAGGGSLVTIAGFASAGFDGAQGGGASGGLVSGSAVGRAGGVGGNGIVIITEFIST
jgi:hypothetical protein